jgi:hypothetical protein
MTDNKKILYSDWLTPKKEKPTTSNRVISEAELADRRLKALASLSMRMACPKYKLRIPISIVGEIND